ncbi:-like protein [Lasallia pustulata]|uniref:-like protein n=1 Tax=Lasallia pustulata TaxID=136370 RepID=A0A1W5CTJ1_9LECA|nr:-like protein [Lasallia pustulata]
MYLAQQDRPQAVPPPLSIGVDRVPPQRNTSYSTPTSSSASAMLPTLPPCSPQAPAATSTVDNGRIYSLDVVQQPVRARMCGFGDKDRRPITPPPCIRLIVQDAITRKKIDISEIDTSYYVLTVDLWSAEGTREVNLVRHSATSPSISAATSSSYPPPPSTPPTYSYSAPYQNHPIQVSGYGQAASLQSQHQHHHQYQQSQHNAYQQTQPSNPYSQQPPPPPPSQQQGYYGQAPNTPMTPTGYYQQTPQQQIQQAPLQSPHTSMGLSGPPQDPRSAPSGMFTRNLIGSLCVSAFKLTDPDNNMGVWFILQDLSVRTEGSFRLKMNFVNVGSPTSPQSLNSGSAPVLASIFSDVFQVFSAKKFPGVIESTGLSKCFATQGIKIPIRKDGGGPGGGAGNKRERDEDED